MKRTTRFLAAAGLSLGLAVAGTGVAQASLSFGTLTVNHDGLQQGQGYGTAYAVASTAKLQSTLRDSRLGGGRTYAKVRAYGRTPDFEMQSGRRADGGSTFAQMAEQSHTNSVPLGGYYAAANVCQDLANQPDPCSSTSYGSY